MLLLFLGMNSRWPVLTYCTPINESFIIPVLTGFLERLFFGALLDNTSKDRGHGAKGFINVLELEHLHV